jgi:hypothetical protein
LSNVGLAFNVSPVAIYISHHLSRHKESGQLGTTRPRTDSGDQQEGNTTNSINDIIQHTHTILDNLSAGVNSVPALLEELEKAPFQVVSPRLGYVKLVSRVAH